MTGSLENMSDTNRFHAWYDQLSPQERSEVDYLTGELKGDFATAYLAVNVHRLTERIGALENRSPFRVGVRELAAGTGAVLAWLGVQHGASSFPK